MGVSKVVYGNRTLIDLTSDTISADKLALGVTAHAADGEAIVGTLQNYLLYDCPVKIKATTVAKSICAGRSDGYRPLKSGLHFDIRYPILYTDTSAALGAVKEDFWYVAKVDVAATQAITLNAYKPVYIKGNLSGTSFTPVSTAPLTQAEPTSADGYQYMLLGIAADVTELYLLPDHPLFVYSGGAFKPFDATQQELDALFGSGSNRRFEVDSNGNLYYVVD